MNTFRERLQELMREKGSILCVGLDVALPRQRSVNVVPARYFINTDDNQGRVNFSLDIIRQTAPFSVVIKVNAQYLHGLTGSQHLRLTEVAHQLKLLTIYDSKFCDIKDSVESALFHCHEWGYDGITFNPLAGNLQEVVQIARKFQPPIGVFVLTLMSNPEAERYMKHATFGGRPIFVAVAEEVKEFGADGCIVAATAPVTEEDIKLVRLTAGNDAIFLVPGIGAQKGDPLKVIRASGGNIIINVSRDIIYSEDPGAKALQYKTTFEKLGGIGII